MSAAESSDGRMRLLKLAEELLGYAATGASNADLADALRTSRPNVTRDMQVLIAQNWARKSEDTGRFYPTTHFSRLCFRVLDDFQRLENRIADTKQAMTGR